MVPVLTSPTLLQNTNSPCFVYFCSCSENQNGHQMVSVLTNPTLQNSTFCCCSVKQNGHQMVPVLTSPPLLQNSTFVVVV